jgi:16S rRNA (adenine(1408)-N(1))-methyltransferase
VIVDLGTGDGRAALAAAGSDPTALVLAIDADAASMAEASRRAARAPARGGRSNALFVVAAAERLPSELSGLADEVRVLFPWGSLLRGVLGRDPAVAAGIATLLAPGGFVGAIVSVAARDGLDGLTTIDAAALDDIADRLAPSGLRLSDAHPATPDEVRATHSSWGRRLLAGDATRPIWHLRLAAATTRAAEGAERSSRLAAV